MLVAVEEAVTEGHRATGTGQLNVGATPTAAVSSTVETSSSTQFKRTFSPVQVDDRPSSPYVEWAYSTRQTASTHICRPTPSLCPTVTFLPENRLAPIHIIRLEASWELPFPPEWGLRAPHALHDRIHNVVHRMRVEFYPEVIDSRKPSQGYAFADTYTTTGSIVISSPAQLLSGIQEPQQLRSDSSSDYEMKPSDRRHEMQGRRAIHSTPQS